jgi:hypothetical protein
MSYRLMPYHRHHPLLTPIPLDFTGIDVPPTSPVVVWVAYRTRKGGKVTPHTPFGNNPPANNRWHGHLQSLIPGGGGAAPAVALSLVPSKPGIYRVVLVAFQNNKPVTYRGMPIRVS